MAEQPVKLILASNSPRRASLLRSWGIRFEIMSPDLAELEPRTPHQIPTHWAEALSYFKARSVARRLTSGYVLSADTLVAIGNEMFGKPRDAEEAYQILRTLSDTTHQVITGVTLLNAASRQRWISHDITEVTMRTMSEEVLTKYIDSGLWEGKAGAYGIQDQSDANIESLDGSYTNVMGLPMELVESMLAEANILDELSGSPEPDALPSKKR